MYIYYLKPWKQEAFKKGKWKGVSSVANATVRYQETSLLHKNISHIRISDNVLSFSPHACITLIKIKALASEKEQDILSCIKFPPFFLSYNNIYGR